MRTGLAIMLDSTCRCCIMHSSRCTCQSALCAGHLDRAAVSSPLRLPAAGPSAAQGGGQCPRHPRAASGGGTCSLQGEWGSCGTCTCGLLYDSTAVDPCCTCCGTAWLQRGCSALAHAAGIHDAVTAGILAASASELRLWGRAAVDLTAACQPPSPLQVEKLLEEMEAGLAVGQGDLDGSSRMLERVAGEVSRLSFLAARGKVRSGQGGRSCAA